MVVFFNAPNQLDGLFLINLPWSSVFCGCPSFPHTHKTISIEASTKGNDTNKCTSTHVQPRGCCCSLYDNCVIRYSRWALSGEPCDVLLNSPFCSPQLCFCTHFHLLGCDVPSLPSTLPFVPHSVSISVMYHKFKSLWVTVVMVPQGNMGII